MKNKNTILSLCFSFVLCSNAAAKDFAQFTKSFQVLKQMVQETAVELQTHFEIACADSDFSNTEFQQIVLPMVTAARKENNAIIDELKQTNKQLVLFRKELEEGKGWSDKVDDLRHSLKRLIQVLASLQVYLSKDNEQGLKNIELGTQNVTTCVDASWVSAYILLRYRDFRSELLKHYANYRVHCLRVIKRTRRVCNLLSGSEERQCEQAVASAECPSLNLQGELPDIEPLIAKLYQSTDDKLVDHIMNSATQLNILGTRFNQGIQQVQQIDDTFKRDVAYTN